jgi:TPR repeat protein
VAALAPRPPERLPKLDAGQAEYRLALATSDPRLAQVLLWRAVAFGSTDAQVRLGEMYVYGQGITPNCGQGLVLLRAAARRGNVRASSKLGALYATGKCVRQDRVIAFRWFSAALAADPRSEWVSANRLIVWRQMSPEERALAARNR